MWMSGKWLISCIMNNVTITVRPVFKYDKIVANPPASFGMTDWMSYVTGQAQVIDKDICLLLVSTQPRFDNKKNKNHRPV